jgi:hypothetical protein
VHRGDLDAARRLLGLYSRLEDSADLQERAGYAAGNACILHAEGRYAEAVAAGAATIETTNTLGVDGQDVKMGVMWALESAIKSDDRGRAEELVAWIEALPRGLCPPTMAGHAHRGRARFAGSGEGAYADHAAAANQFRDLGIRFWLAVSLLEHAEALTADGRSDEAAPLLEEARQIFTELGARPWLDRAEALGGHRSAQPVS